MRIEVYARLSTGNVELLTTVYSDIAPIIGDRICLDISGVEMQSVPLLVEGIEVHYTDTNPDSFDVTRDYVKVYARSS